VWCDALATSGHQEAHSAVLDIMSFFLVAQKYTAPDAMPATSVTEN
jgi:hypothetical protein